MTQYFEIRDDKILMLSREKFLDMTISQILKGSYLVKREVDGKTVRYASDDLAWEKASSRGETKWLHDLFASLVEDSGIIASESLTTKLSGLIHRVAVQTAKAIFPGAVDKTPLPPQADKPKVTQENLSFF